MIDTGDGYEVIWHDDWYELHTLPRRPAWPLWLLLPLLVLWLVWRGYCE